MSYETPERELPVLNRAGRYHLRHPIGRGAASAVYRGLLMDAPSSSNDDVAVKVFLADWVEGSDVREAFAAEVSLLRSLDHPAIVRAFEAGETDEGFPFIVYEWIEGDPLADLLAHSALPVQRACQMVLTLAEALDHTH